MINTNEERIKVLELKREEINKVSPSFCSAKWLQTTLYLQNGFNHSCHHPSAHKIPVEEVKANPAALHNSKFKKEQMFVQMLEGLHESEAKLLIAAKDKKLHQVYKGLSKEVVKEAFNWNDDFVNPNS